MEKKRKQIIWSILLMGIVVIAMIWGDICYSNRNRPHQITSNEKKAIPDHENHVQKPLKIGITPSFPPEKEAWKWEYIIDYLKKELEMPVESVFRSSYGEIRDMLVKGELDVCFTTSYTYILASQEARITPLVRRIKCGSSSYYSLIIVREDSGISKFEGLKGKRFAFTDPESTTGWLLPMAKMIKEGVSDPNDYFSEVIFTTDHESALIAVFNGRVEGAAITSTLLCSKDPKIKDKLKDLKIIWKSEAVPLGPFSVGDELDKGLKEKIKKAFLKIGKTADTRSLAKYLDKELDIQGFEEAKDMDYDFIRRDCKLIQGIMI